MGYPNEAAGYPGNAPGNAPPPAYGAPGFAPGFAPGSPPAPQVTMVMSAPIVGPDATRMVCPHCNADITTSVEHVASNRTHLMALLLCLICPFGCCFIPYCTDSCLSTTHTCPLCRRFIGTYDK